MVLSNIIPPLRKIRRDSVSLRTNLLKNKIKYEDFKIEKFRVIYLNSGYDFKKPIVSIFCTISE
jgi:hypothetical protein